MRVNQFIKTETADVSNCWSSKFQMEISKTNTLPYINLNSL